MKVYIASSWKNSKSCILLAELLRNKNIEVDCFCDEKCDRFIFRWIEIAEDLMKYDAVSFLEDERVQKAFEEDKKWIEWAD